MTPLITRFASCAAKKRLDDTNKPFLSKEWGVARVGTHSSERKGVFVSFSQKEQQIKTVSSAGNRARGNTSVWHRQFTLKGLKHPFTSVYDKKFELGIYFNSIDDFWCSHYFFNEALISAKKIPGLM